MNNQVSPVPTLYPEQDSNHDVNVHASVIIVSGVFIPAELIDFVFGCFQADSYSKSESVQEWLAKNPDRALCFFLKAWPVS